MKFICAQPAIPYYSWQVEVIINNFIKNGVNPNDIHILGAIYNNQVPQDWRKLAEAYKDVCFFFYMDTRGDGSYIPSIYFNMMKQHLKANPHLEKEALFLHDSDIIFTRPVDFSDMENDDVWYLSDTVGYIGTQYILTKGEELLKENKDVVVLQNLLSGKTKEGIYGDEFFVVNQKIVDLSEPLISDENKELVEMYQSESMDPDGRGHRNLIRMMMEDGFFKYLPKGDDAWVSFLKPFLKLTRKEKSKFRNKK